MCDSWAHIGLHRELDGGGGGGVNGALVLLEANESLILVDRWRPMCASWNRRPPFRVRRRNLEQV